MNRGGIFLDRDGTINTEVDFLSRPDTLDLIPRSADAIREANTLGFKVFIVTNQSGIARGFLTEEQLALVHQELTHQLLLHHARVDAMYYCPHHPDLGSPAFRKKCDCRKPNTGMIMRAAEEFQIDLKHSFMIGDRLDDIIAGNKAGMTSILVLTGYGREAQRMLSKVKAKVDHVADDLYGAIQYVKLVTHPEQKATIP